MTGSLPLALCFVARIGLVAANLGPLQGQGGPAASLTPLGQGPGFYILPGGNCPEDDDIPSANVCTQAATSLGIAVAPTVVVDDSGYTPRGCWMRTETDDCWESGSSLQCPLGFSADGAAGPGEGYRPICRRAPQAVDELIPNVDAVRQHGMLRVEGNEVVGQHGTPVRLRGMSLFWSQWYPQFYNAEAVAWLKNDWHITLIRAAMAVEHGGYLTNPGAERAKVEAVVEAAITEGIYVVIDWHDHHAEEHLDEAKQFFSEMACKYGGYANVIFEPYNEPEAVSWSDVIKPYHQEIVRAIREHSENLIVLGTGFYSQDVDVASEDPVGGENLAYTIHFYAASHGQFLRDKVSAALSNGIAIFATEWGTCTFTGNGMLGLESAQDWQNFFEENHISDANWAVSDKDESCAALLPGASGTGSWPMAQLTQSGAWMRGSIRGYNSALPLGLHEAFGLYYLMSDGDCPSEDVIATASQCQEAAKSLSLAVHVEPVLVGGGSGAPEGCWTLSAGDPCQRSGSCALGLTTVNGARNSGAYRPLCRRA